MPIRDLPAMNASLDNDYGQTRGPNSPASFRMALFDGDPMADGIEQTGPGYARVTIQHSQFAAAVDGIKSLTAPAQFPAPTGEWEDPVTHWGLYAADGVTMWDSAALEEELLITEAADLGPAVQISIFYADAIVDDDPEEV